MYCCCPEGAIYTLRDVTRGGLGTVLNDVAHQSGVVIAIDERAIPVLPQVEAACGRLDLDPLCVANEGKLVAAVVPGHAGVVLAAMQAHPMEAHAFQIGEFSVGARRFVRMVTAFGGQRMVDRQRGELFHRIC